MTRLELLGLNIKKYREAKNLSQEKLAELVDLSREYIVRVEKGKKYISLKRLFLITDVLEIPFKKMTDFE